MALALLTRADEALVAESAGNVPVDYGYEVLPGATLAATAREPYGRFSARPGTWSAPAAVLRTP